MPTEATVAMAAAQFQRGDAAGAVELLGPVLAGEPDNLRALVLMTHAQLALDHPDRAHQAAHQAVQVAPESAEALGALSRACTGLGRHAEGVDLAQRAVRLEPENPYRHNRLAWALLEDGQRPVEAEHAARQAVHLDPQEADFRITYAMVMKQLNKLDRARNALTDALALEPDNAVAQHELATLDVVHGNPFALGRLARGASGLAGALRTDPTQQASKFMLDVALRRFLVGSSIALALLAYVGWRVLDYSVPWARGLAAFAALAPAAGAVYFVRQLDRPLRGYLLTVLTYGRQRVAAIFGATGIALLLAATVAPVPWLGWLLGVAAATGFLARLLTVSASNAHVRSAGIDVPPPFGTVALSVIAVLVGLIGLFVLAAGADDGNPGMVGFGSVLLLVAVAAAGTIVVRRRRRA